MAKSAHYRFEVKIVSKGKNARSVVAKAAYRSGSRLHDEQTGRTYNYTARSQEIVSSTILTPHNAPEWMKDEEKLWNGVEAVSTRSNARMAREFLPSIPNQLSEKQGEELILGWTEKELVSRGMVAQVSIHRSSDGHNPHAHILCTTRDVDPEAEEGFGKVNTSWNEVKLLEHLRESYAQAVNEALEKAGREERVDHRSLADQGIDREPEPKIGVAATAMMRRGVEPEPEKVSQWRKVKLMNMVKPHIDAIKETGSLLRDKGAALWEVAQKGMAHTVQKAVELARDESSGVPLPQMPAKVASRIDEWQERVRRQMQEEMMQKPLDNDRGMGFSR